MPRYLISFDDGSMTFPEEELPQVSRDAHAVVAEAKAAGVWIFGGGIDSPEVSVVATDGTARRNPLRGPDGGPPIREIAVSENDDVLALGT